MKKSVSYFVALLVILIIVSVALANMHYISSPRLVIRFEGKPASNAELVLPISSGSQYRLDDKGSITAPEIGWKSIITLRTPDGGGVTVGFPRHGTKVIDFQGRMTTTTTVQYFGLVSNQSDAFTLTDADIADIESGRKSSAEIVEGIRRANRQAKDN